MLVVKSKHVEGLSQVRLPIEGGVTRKYFIYKTIKREKGKNPSLNFVVPMLLLSMELLLLFETCGFCQSARVIWLKQPL